MKIHGWSIDAFGFLENVVVRELPDGLTVFYGSNEVVKRAILSFLQGGLFGFEIRRDDPDSPETGRGGRLVVGDPTGHFTVERSTDNARPFRIVRPDGAEGTSEDLDRLLGGVSRSVFDSIFLLRRSDLQSLSKLDGEQWRNRLVSIPTVGGEAARRVATRLGARANDLLAPDADSSIGKTVAKIQTLRSQLDSARRASLGYRDLQRTAEETGADIARLSQVLQSSVAEQERCARLLTLLPTWKALREARRSLEAFEPIDDLPADLETQLTLASARTAAAGSSLQRLREQQATTLRQRREREPSAAFEIVTDSVEDLQAAVPRHRERLGNLTHTRVRWERAKRTVEDKIAQLGADWNVARVVAFDVSRPMNEEARAWQRRLSHAAEDEQRARQALDDAMRRRDSYQRRRAESSERHGSSPIADSAPPIDVRLATARLSTNLAAFPAGQMRAEVRKRIVEEHERLLRTVEMGDVPAMPGWSWMVPWLLLLGAAVMTVERGVRGDWRSVLVLEMAVLLAVGVAYVSRKMRRQSGEEERRKQELEALREDLENAQRQRDAYWLSNVALQRVIAEDSETLGLDSLPQHEAPIPALPRARVARNESVVQPRGPLRDDLAEVIEQTEREIRVYTQRLADMRALASRMEAEWTAWKAGLGLPARLSPEGVSEFLAELREAQLALVARDAAEDTLRDLEDLIAKWELRARTNLARAGMPVGDEIRGEALIEELTLLRNRCVRAAQERSSLAALDREIEDRAAKIAAVESDIRQLEEDRAALLRASGCMDEADFHRKRKIFEERSDLKRVMDEYEARLASTAECPDLEATLADLAAGSEEEWQRAGAEAECRIRETREALRIAEERHRQASEECGLLEESDEVPTLELRCAEALAELSEAVHGWRVIAVAQGLMEDSVRELEATRVPSVLGEASSSLAAISGGRYRQIRRDDRRTGLLLIEGEGRSKPLDECTTEEMPAIYLSARLGLLADFTGRRVALPLIVDDVMVGLDRDLARGLATALGKMAQEKQQVLFFTCDPETCVLLADHAKAARVVQI